MSDLPTEQVPARSGVSPPKQPTGNLFGGCWSCRLLSGTGLLLSAGYVFMGARKTMKLGGPTSIGTVAQIVFSAALASWGTVVLLDPVGKAQRKTA